MSELIKIDSNISPDVLRIELFLSNLCNYKCWYCFPGSNEGTHRWPDLDPLIDNLSFLFDYYIKNKGKKKFNIHIIGGEPTIWKNLGDFARHFKQHYNCRITMSTNGSRTLRWWEEHGKDFDEVMISCHHEFVDVDHVSAVANILYEKKVWSTAMVLMDPNAWERCLTLIEQLKKSNNGWPITALEVYHHTISYTEEQKRYLNNSIKKMPNPWYYLRSKKTEYRKPTVYFDNGTNKRVDVNWISLNGLNHFYGWECNIGVDTVYVNKDGFLTAACGEFLYDLNFKYNVFEKDFPTKFNPEIKPTVCRQQSCHCQPEINCRKELKTKALAPVWLAEYPLHRYTSL